MVFINTFVDMIRLLDTEFNMVVDCIENGTIPDLDGIAEVRHYLEVSAGYNRVSHSKSRLVEYVGGPRTCGGGASTRSTIFSTRVVWSRLAELAFSHCYCQWFLYIVCPTGTFVVRVPGLHLLTVHAQAEWFLGPNAAIRALAYGTTEALVGLPYNPLELNGFKLTNETLVEFLDIGKDYSINSLVQAVSTPREMRFLADRECSGKLRWEGDTKLW